jgi:hypothetical protein
VIALRHSYDSPEELVWMKKNKIKEHSPYDYYDDAVETDTMVTYDSTVTTTIESPPPPPDMEAPMVEENYVEEPTSTSKTYGELLLDSFHSDMLLSVPTNQKIPFQPVSVVFTKDSTYRITANGVTEKGRWKFYPSLGNPAEGAVILEPSTGGQKYCPLFIIRNYRTDSLEQFSMVIMLPGEKTLKKVFLESGQEPAKK